MILAINASCVAGHPQSRDRHHETMRTMVNGGAVDQAISRAVLPASETTGRGSPSGISLTRHGLIRSLLERSVDILTYLVDYVSIISERQKEGCLYDKAQGL